MKGLVALSEIGRSVNSSLRASGTVHYYAKVPGDLKPDFKPRQRSAADPLATAEGTKNHQAEHLLHCPQQLLWVMQNRCSSIVCLFLASFPMGLRLDFDLCDHHAQARCIRLPIPDHHSKSFAFYRSSPPLLRSPSPSVLLAWRFSVIYGTCQVAGRISCLHRLSGGKK